MASSTALIDMIVILGTSDLRYISTGQPVESPPWSPSRSQLHTVHHADAGVEQDSKYNGSNGIVYDLQVDDPLLLNSGAALITHENLGVDTKTLATNLTGGSFYYWRVRADARTVLDRGVRSSVGVDGTLQRRLTSTQTIRIRAPRHRPLLGKRRRIDEWSALICGPSKSGPLRGRSSFFSD